MNKFSIHSISLSLVLMLSGCATHKMTRSSALKPTKIEAKQSYVIPLDATVKENLVWTDETGKFHVLSEVSPDAVVTSVTNLTNKVTAKLKDGAELTGEQATQITQNLSELGKRTVAVSILRDALYRLEEYNVNKSDPSKEMDEKTFQLFNTILGVAKDIALVEADAEKTKQVEAKAKIEEAKTKQAETNSESNNKNSMASEWEVKGFNLLLSNDIDAAIEAFRNAENIFPTYHNVYEIGKILKTAKSENKMVKPDSEEAKSVLRQILSQYSWGMPDDIRLKLEEKSKK